MSDFTPDEHTVRHAYRVLVKTADNPRYERAGREPMTEEEIDEEFDRFLGKIKSEVWDEAVGACAEQGTIQIPDNPHRDTNEK